MVRRQVIDPLAWCGLCTWNEETPFLVRKLSSEDDVKVAGGTEW